MMYLKGKTFEFILKLSHSHQFSLKQLKLDEMSLNYEKYINFVFKLF